MRIYWRIITTVIAALVIPVMTMGAFAPDALLDRPNVAALKTTKTGIGVLARTQGYYTAGDGGDAFYTFSTSPCSLNAGAGDNGSQIKPTLGTGCWKASFSNGLFSAKVFGAKGDGTTDDSAAFAAAAAACTVAGGGTITLPATGHSYRVVTWATINAALGAGCGYAGIVGTMNWSPTLFYDNVETDWTAAGSWIRSEDLTNGMVLTKPGQFVRGLNFWYTQPTPSSTTCTAPPCTFNGSSWAPTGYPYTITVANTSNFNKIEDVNIVNAYDCIDLEGQTGGIAGIYTRLNNLGLGCFDRDFKFNRIDNTLSVSNIREMLLWYQGSVDVFNYIYNVGNHGIGWDVNYLANIEANNVEITWKKLGILLTDGTVTNGFGSLTFAGAGWQINGLSFNENCQGIKVATNTTHFSSPITSLGVNVFTNVLAYADTQFSKAGQCGGNTTGNANSFFDFGSDNLAVQMHGLQFGNVDTLVNLGGASGGAYFGLYGVRGIAYSAFNTGKPAFAIGNALNFFEPVGSLYNVLPATGAGPLVSGQTTAPFTTLNELQVEGNAGTTRQVCWGTNPAAPTTALTSRRWCFRADLTAEGGSNAGTNLDIDRYSDAGVYIDTPLSVNRATGLISLNDAFAHKSVTASQLTGALACSGSTQGWELYVTDLASAPALGAAITTGSGGGTNRAHVTCDGANWAASK